MLAFFFFWRERVRRPAAARTTEQASNLLCGPFLSCQIELMIYPLWQQVSCSHTGCPVMQYTPRLIFTPSLITLDSGVSKMFARAQGFRSRVEFMDFVDWKLPLTCAHTIKSRIWLSHPSASSGVRGSVLSSSCTPHSACKVSTESGFAVPVQFVICVGVLFFLA